MITRKRLLLAMALAAAGTAAARAALKRPGNERLPAIKGMIRHDIIVPAGRMAVYEAGTGAPIVFVHGIGGGASSWTWGAVAKDLASTHRVMAPDLIGWGASDHPARSILFDDYVTSLEALLDTVGEPAIVVAQSLACGFVMALAERRPELVSRIVLITPSGGKDFGVDAFGPVARNTLASVAKVPVVNVALYKALFHRAAFIRGWLTKQGFADPLKVTDEVVEAFRVSACQPNAACSALPFVTGELRYDIAPYLQRLQVPATILWGAQETQIGVLVRERLFALRPDVSVTCIANSKACPELEQPGAVTAAIREFIA